MNQNIAVWNNHVLVFEVRVREHYNFQGPTALMSDCMRCYRCRVRGPTIVNADSVCAATTVRAKSLCCWGVECVRPIVVWCEAWLE